MNTDEKATNKLLFPIYPQMLLISKYSKSKFSPLLVMNYAYNSTQNYPKNGKFLKDILSTLEINHESLVHNILYLS